MVILAIGQMPNAPAALAAKNASCLEQSHRFEHMALHAPQLERSKRLLIYLPPGYDCDHGQRYPVFYLNDGHDLFDWDPLVSMLDPALAAAFEQREAWYGSWRLEWQLTEAVRSGVLPPLIVVGIASDDGFRSGDLVPVPWDGSFEGRGIDHGRFVADIVVAFVDRRFRTLRQRACRGIGGASLGAISALQIGLAHPQQFGLVLALSPVLNDPSIARFMADAWNASKDKQQLAWLLDFDDVPVGIADQQWARSTFILPPPQNDGLILTRSPGGRHMISSWANRALPAMTALINLMRACPWPPVQP